VDVTDAVVRLRPMREGEAGLLIAGRDDEWRRWLGPGSDDPSPTACIEVGGALAGWVDYDTAGREWLPSGAVNIGYNVFPEHRGRGYATRAVRLLVHHLATHTDVQIATVLIDRRNRPSLAVAARAGFEYVKGHDGSDYFERPVPPTSYTDGVVTIRRQSTADIDHHLASIDDVQIDWLWLPGQRESWEAMTRDRKREHARGVLRSNHDQWGHGPKWTFAVDTPDVPYVAYVDCDLANDTVPHGEANVSYSAHTLHRGRGYVSRAVRLIFDFVREHTGAREAHIGVDADNEASLRVARAVGAAERRRWVNERGRTMVQHVFDLRA
jgi:RimJ/RimL family protein N-acetyltransferase